MVVQQQIFFYMQLSSVRYKTALLWMEDALLDAEEQFWILPASSGALTFFSAYASTFKAFN